MSVTVADLVAVLSLKTTGFDQADKLIERLKTGAANAFAFDKLETAARDFAGMVKGVLNTGDALDEQAQKTGVSVEALQELGYAASLSSVSQDTLGRSLGRLAKDMDAARRGGKEQSAALKAAGVDMVGLRNGTLKADDAFMMIADHIADMPDGFQKNALAQRVFGKSGADLIPVLNNGADGLEELRQEANDLGLVMSGDTAKSMGELNDQIEGRLGGTLEGLKRMLVTALLPTLQEVAKQFVEWFRANREILKQKVAAFAKILSVALLAVAKAAGFVLDVFSFLEEHWDQAKFAIYAVVAALAIYEAATIAAGIASALSWLAALWPIGLVIAAIGLVALAVEDLYTYFEGGDSVFGRLVDAAKQYLGVDLTDTIAGVVTVATMLFEQWWSNLKLLFQYVAFSFDVVKTTVEHVWAVVKPIVEAMKEAVGYVDDLTNSSFNPLGGNFGGSGTNLTGGRLLGGKDARFGGGLTQDILNGGVVPTRAAGGNSLLNNVFKPNITIQVPAGADAPEIAHHVKHAMEEYHRGWLRDAMGGIGGDGEED